MRVAPSFIGAIAMLGPCSRGYDHHRNSPRRGEFWRRLHHQFVSGHARHLEVSDDQMAPVLRHQFGGFQSVRPPVSRGISFFFQHPADEFAYADGVVRHYDYAALARRGRWPRKECFRERSPSSPAQKLRAAALALACIGRRSLGSVATMRFKSISRRIRLPSGGDSRAREKVFNAAQVFAKILDDDFVFAKKLPPPPGRSSGSRRLPPPSGNIH